MAVEDLAPLPSDEHRVVAVRVIPCAGVIDATGGRGSARAAGTGARTGARSAPGTTKPAVLAGFRKYRYGDSNPGFRRERAAS